MGVPKANLGYGCWLEETEDVPDRHRQLSHFNFFQIVCQCFTYITVCSTWSAFLLVILSYLQASSGVCVCGVFYEEENTTLLVGLKDEAPSIT